jgi:Activator of Hsp90 ATPase homolog 1-like protein
MPDILHRVGIRSSTRDAYKALGTIDGLAGWWTSTTSGESRVGGKIRFQFGERGFFHATVVEQKADESIVWDVFDGPEEWMGTRISFHLKQEGEQATVTFKHTGWTEPVEFMHHCSTKWAVFLMSLKAFVETGRGAPYPDDTRITVNWD